MPDAQPAYIPGVCNINTAEVAKRRRLGRRGLTIFIIALAVLLLSNISRNYRIVLFLPAFAAVTGYLQARNKFCVGYAGAGMQNATHGSKEASEINNKADVIVDKLKARRMNLQSLNIALAATIIAILIPHI